MRLEMEDGHQTDYKNHEAETNSVVFPAIRRASGTHGAQPAIIGSQAVDKYRGKLAHDYLSIQT